MFLIWIGRWWQCIFKTPWKGGAAGSKKAEEELANCNVVWLWFIEKYPPDTGMMSKMVMKVRSVETQLRLLISFELLEFLAQSTSPRCYWLQRFIRRSHFWSMTMRPICLSFGFLESSTPKPRGDDCWHPSYCLFPGHEACWQFGWSTPLPILGYLSFLLSIQHKCICLGIVHGRC